MYQDNHLEWSGSINITQDSLRMTIFGTVSLGANLRAPSVKSNKNRNWSGERTRASFSNRGNRSGSKTKTKSNGARAPGPAHSPLSSETRVLIGSRPKLRIFAHWKAFSTHIELQSFVKKNFQRFPNIKNGFKRYDEYLPFKRPHQGIKNLSLIPSLRFL